MFSDFPAGPPGLGLLLLRLAAVILLVCATLRSGLSLIDVVTSFLAVALFAGMFARFAGAACAGLAVIWAIATGGDIGVLIGLQALSAAAITLLGPGAYSIDARLFGRSVIEVR